jgi:hypothetical protein
MGLNSQGRPVTLETAIDRLLSSPIQSSITFTSWVSALRTRAGRHRARPTTVSRSLSDFRRKQLIQKNFILWKLIEII